MTPYFQNNYWAVFGLQFAQRGIISPHQYTTPVLFECTPKDRAELNSDLVIWGPGHSYAKLAHKYYGDSTLWWVIAWYNEKPAEFLLRAGDAVYVPTPVEKAIAFFGI